MSNYTPGPWGVDETASAKPFIAAESREIATCRKDLSEDWHNAQLICAAPDLLEALQALLARFDPYAIPDMENNLALVAKCEAAINKAIGEQK